MSKDKPYCCKSKHKGGHDWITHNNYNGGYSWALGVNGATLYYGVDKQGKMRP